MKITKNKLKQIIKEEIQHALRVNESAKDLQALARAIIEADYALTNGGTGVFDGDASEVRCHYPKLDKKLAPHAGTILSILKKKDVKMLTQILATIKSLDDTTQTYSYTLPSDSQGLLNTFINIRDFLDDDAPCEDIDDDDEDLLDDSGDDHGSDTYSYDTAHIAHWPKHYGRVPSRDNENNLRWSL